MHSQPDQLTAGTDHFIEMEGLRFHYRAVGDPEGPPVVMLHGIMGHSREWDAMVELLVPPFRVICLDQRGHGETDWAESYTTPEMAGDVIAIVERLGMGPVSLIGHSMGGMAALVATARRPDLVERLVVIDIGPGALSTPFAAEAPVWMKAMAEQAYPTVEAAVEEWASGNPLAREDLLHHYVRHCLVARPGGGLGWRFDAAGLVSFFTAGVTEQELWDAIGGVTCPTLLVRGAHSGILGAAEAAQMAARLSEPRVVEIPGGGHDLGVEQPEAVARAVLDFFPA